MVEEASWNETNWELKNAIVTYKTTYNIRTKGKTVKKPPYNKDNALESTKIEADLVEYKDFVKEIVGLLQGNHTSQTRDEKALTKDIDDLIKFERELDELERRYKKFRTDEEKLIMQTNSTKVVGKPAFRSTISKVVFLNFLQPFIYANKSDFEGSVDEKVFDEFVTFYEKAPKR